MLCARRPQPQAPPGAAPLTPTPGSLTRPLCRGPGFVGEEGDTRGTCKTALSAHGRPRMWPLEADVMFR